MTHVLSKKTLGYALGALLALLVAAPVLMLGADTAHAQALTQDELFGGTSGDAGAFAADAGLGDADLTTTIASIIRTVMGFLGIIAVIIILIGGFLWMTSGGNEEKVKKAKKVIVSGVIGLVIVIAAFSIASFVITQIAGVATA